MAPREAGWGRLLARAGEGHASIARMSMAADI